MLVGDYSVVHSLNTNRILCVMSASRERFKQREKHTQLGECTTTAVRESLDLIIENGGSSFIL